MLIGNAIALVVMRPNLGDASKKFCKGAGDGFADVVILIAAAAFFCAGMKSMGMIAINRQKGVSAYASFLHRGREFLRSGWWVILFPEGTRVAWKTQKPYKTGGARFAAATGAWVLPVAHDAGRLWPRNTVAKTPGVIHVVFGPLIKTEGETFQTIHQATQSWIEGEVARMVEADA